VLNKSVRPHEQTDQRLVETKDSELAHSMYKELAANLDSMVLDDVEFSASVQRAKQGKSIAGFISEMEDERKDYHG